MTGVAEYMDQNRRRTREFEADLTALVDCFTLERVVTYDYLASGLMNP